MPITKSVPDWPIVPDGPTVPDWFGAGATSAAKSPILGLRPNVKRRDNKYERIFLVSERG
jgi:hypothetical protein